MDREERLHKLRNGTETAQWAENEISRAYNEAAQLAMFLWNKYYKADSPNFELCDSTQGIISQIDNMLSGLKMERDA